MAGNCAIALSGSYSINLGCKLTEFTGFEITPKCKEYSHGPGTDSSPVSNSANIIHLTIENYFIISRSVTTIRNLLILLLPSAVWYATKVVTTLLQPSS